MSSMHVMDVHNFMFVSLLFYNKLLSFVYFKLLFIVLDSYMVTINEGTINFNLQSLYPHEQAANKQLEVKEKVNR